MTYEARVPYYETRMGKVPDDGYQFCIVKLKSGDYELLRSKAPEKNVPSEYSKHVGIGTVEELIKIRSEIKRGVRNIEGVINF